MNIDTNNVIAIIITIPFLILVIYGTYKQIKHFIKRNFSGYKEVIGTVINHEMEYSNDGDGTTTYYKSVIEYIVEGRKYQIIDSSSSNFKTKLNTNKKIMYNPKNPSQAIVKNNIDGITIVVTSIIFLISLFNPSFIPIGLIIFFLTLIISIYIQCK